MELIDLDSVVTYKSYKKEMVTEREMTVRELIKWYTKTGKVQTIDPVRHGEWVNVSKNKSLKLWQCSVCMEKFYNVTFRYCPNCGAKMDE